MTGRIARRALLALLLAPAVAPFAARAHDGPHAANVGVAVHGARKVADGVLEATLTLTNATGVALTLRGVHCDQARSTRLLRRTRFLGVETWNEVDLLRLDPGEQIALAPPDYVIEIAGAPEGETLLNLTLDFGPAGERALVLFVTD